MLDERQDDLSDAARTTTAKSPQGRSSADRVVTHGPGRKVDERRSVGPDARRGDAKGGRILSAQLLRCHADARDPRAVLRQIGGTLVRPGMSLSNARGALERDHLAARCVAVEVQ